jgi:Carboxypeptidase regulatory-like domain/TonB dependent receptor
MPLEMRRVMKLKVLQMTMLQVLALQVLVLAVPAFAQSPNTATLVVTVTDSTGAVLPGARVTLVNSDTGAKREAATGSDGSSTIAALPVSGTWVLGIAMPGFVPQNDARDLKLRAGETATVKVTLAVGEKSEVTVYGTTEGVRATPQAGQRFDSRQIEETPILGRKLSSVPLLNAAFRPGKGTGDLFVNTTYVVTGAGGRRETTVALDGASDDEPWGRQTGAVTVPIGAVQEMAALTNSFSSEFGWTAGPAVNIVTKSGTNAVRGEGLFLGRPSATEAKSFSTKNLCPSSISTCIVPSTLTSITAADTPDVLGQVSGTVGGPIAKDRTFFFAADDYTMQNRTTLLSSALPAFVLSADGSLSYVGRYRQELGNFRVDHKFTPLQALMVRVNIDRFHDTNPQDTVGGTSAPTVARTYARRGWSAQANHTTVINPALLNEARFDFLDADPVTEWTPATLSTAYTRSGSVPFTIGQSRAANLYSRQAQFSDTLTWSRGRQLLRAGGAATRSTSGGTGGEFGTATLGTFTFRNTTTAPFDQLTLADVQQYTQPISFGITRYVENQWLLSAFAQDAVRATDDLTLDAGLRYDRQTLTNATGNIEPRVGFGWHPKGSAALAVRGGYGMYYTQIRANVVAAALTGGLNGLTTYTAVPGQLGFPSCLTGSCLPLSFDPATLAPSQLPARDITILPGKRSFYEQQFAQYGLNFDAVPNYPDRLTNPRSQVASIGAEREFGRGLFVSADYVHQWWTNIDRTVDLNAPAPFDRSSPGQVRTVAAANATRAILPFNGGVRQVNVLMNLGDAEYDALQTQVSYRGNPRLFASLSYTLSKSMNNTEPDGNGIGPNDSNIARLKDPEWGPSLLDQRHRAVATFTYQLPLNVTAGTVTEFGSARPVNATTGVDNNGDGLNNDRPVINGAVAGKSAFHSTPTSNVSLFGEERIKIGARTLLLRVEGFNVFNHLNVLGRAQTIYGDTGVANPTFGQLVAVTTASAALPSVQNIDTSRMVQFQVRFQF